MKAKVFLLIFMLTPFFILSQQINKELVVVEIATGTWCPYCPGAAMGADELVQNFGEQVAIIEHHGGDIYENNASQSRISYYGISNYPTAVFNGLNSYVGGSSTQSMYSNYLPRYNAAMNVLTSFDITMDVEPVNDYTYSVTVTFDKVDDYGGSNLTAFLALTESHIDESWQGMEELNFVNREMFPSSNGTALNFSSTDQQIIYYNVVLDQEWRLENCELVAFMQDSNTKEILQGTKISLNFPIGSNNAMLFEINYPTGLISICEDAVCPVITIKNRGSENLTSLVVEYEINDEGLQTYNWIGDLAFGESEEVTLNEIAYNPIETNIFEVNLTLPNNMDDDDISNNSKEISFDKSVETTTRTYLEIDPNGSFGLPWQVAESDGTVVYSGNASGSNIVSETFILDLNNCYSFTISSQMGNGIPGDGYFKLTDSEGNVFYYGEGDSFTESYILPFKVTIVSNINNLNSESIRLYPNPVHDKLYIENINESVQLIIITDISGKDIYSLVPDKNSGKISVQTEELMTGLYFVKIYALTDKYSEKIVVIH